jgi:hypothetical protein
MDKVEYTEQERWLIEPKPGTAAARARDFGIDLSITVSNLRLTAEQRIKKLDETQHSLRKYRVDLQNDHDRELATLLELEAILEYRRVTKTGKF